ncbi:hypothetical protein J6P92_05120 [bacterium]|nr:hypothetical protein [bacterium]
MTKQITQKYNDSCIKLFNFLKMLYEGDVEFKTVINHFSDGSYDGTSNTHVTLNKYLNALKIFGINIKKVKHKYTLQSPVYKINFSNEDYKCINLLKEHFNNLPEGKNKKTFESFLRALEIRLDDTGKNNAEANISPNDTKFSSSEMVEQIKLYNKYCQDKMKLEILYTNDKGENINLLCSPQEVSYIKRKVCLKVIGNNGSRIYDIPLEAVKSINQTGSKVSGQSIPTTITFRIKNRLAKNYRMRDCEHLETIESNGNKIIVNQGEDLDILLKRLMKYGNECEVISPKFYKDEILNRINKTLSNYQ